jgi:carbon storage regulator
MIVLGRKPNEKIYIGHDIFVELCQLHTHYARIGVSAPSTVPVHREEVYKIVVDSPTFSGRVVSKVLCFNSMFMPSEVAEAVTFESGSDITELWANDDVKEAHPALYNWLMTNGASYGEKVLIARGSWD